MLEIYHYLLEIFNIKTTNQESKMRVYGVQIDEANSTLQRSNYKLRCAK